MSGTVAEFMEKPVKKYACGRKAREAKKSLIKAFTASNELRRFQEAAMFEEIVDSVMKTEKGRETMTTLSKLGYSFAFETGNFGGFCSAERKKIVINPEVSFSYMLQTAVHEGRHAIQGALADPDAPACQNTQVASLIRCRRAQEADAVAHQMAFVYQCKGALPEVYQDAKEQNTPMFRAFTGEMEKSGDERKAMQASFAAWYESEYYRNFYDKTYKNNVKQICELGKQEQNKDFFKEEYPAEDILKMCRYKGQVYMKPEFLNKGLAFSVPVEHKKEIADMVSDYAKTVGVKADESVLTMRSRLPDGTLLPEDNNAVKTAVAAKMARNGR